MEMVPRSARIWSRQSKTKVFMKFLTLRTKRAHRGGKLEKRPGTALDSLTKPCGVPHEAHTYGELRQQIHDDLRIQHPEWIQPNGECPMCDAYEARLMELVDPLRQKPHNEFIAAPDPTLEHGLN
jgi:hypothetical protein